MHQWFERMKTKEYDIRQSPDNDGYLITTVIRITPVSKHMKIQSRTKFGLTFNSGKTKVVSGPQCFVFGFRFKYCQEGGKGCKRP